MREMAETAHLVLSQKPHLQRYDLANFCEYATWHFRLRGWASCRAATVRRAELVLYQGLSEGSRVSPTFGRMGISAWRPRAAGSLY